MNYDFKLIVGLGNPGHEYQQTRHNVGCLALEYLAAQYAACWRLERQWQAQMATITIAGIEYWLMRPQTYMNHSGTAVGAWANYYRLAPRQIVVFHDELDLAFGSIKSKLGGGLNGHNGLRSIAQALNQQVTFARIKLGIGRPSTQQNVADYVLGRFSADETQLWQQQFILLADAFPQWLATNGTESLNLNLRPNSQLITS